MAIAFDASKFGHDNGNANATLSFAHTCSGSNRILFVFTQGDQGGSDLVTGITYNGVALTKITTTQGTSGTRFIGAWYLVNPSTGTNNVVITASATSYIQGYASSYTGASQTGVPDATHTNFSGSTTTLADTVTTIADNCWVVMFTRLDSNGGPGNAGTGTTRRETDTDFDSSSLFDSNGAVTPAGSKTLTCNAAGIADPMADIIISFAPVGASVAAPFPTSDTDSPKRHSRKDVNYESGLKLELIGKDTFFGAPGQAPTYDLDKPRKLKSNARLSFEGSTNISLYFAPPPFIVFEDTIPRRRKTNTLNYESSTNLNLVTVPVQPFIAYEVDRSRIGRRADRNFEFNSELTLIVPFGTQDIESPRTRKRIDNSFISNVDINLIQVVTSAPFIANETDTPRVRRRLENSFISTLNTNLLIQTATPFIVTEVTIPRRALRKQNDFNSSLNLNLRGQDKFFGAPGQSPLFDLKNPNTHKSNARLSYEVPVPILNRIVPPPVDDTTALILFGNLHIRLDVKREMDSGSVDALASDLTGTPVLFNKAFLDVDSITLTVAATQPITAIYDFVDVPNPTGFSVYAYDSSGNRVNFIVSWKARGIV